MTHRVLPLLAAAFLLSGTLAAQQGAGQTAQELTEQQMRANAFAAAQRLTECAMAVDLACYRAMLDEERRPPPVDARDLDIIDPREGRVSRLQSSEPDFFHSTDVAEPWSPIAGDGEVFIIVPAFSTYGVERLGLRVDAAFYLIGVSDDGGESWRFVPVFRSPQTRPDVVDRLIPGYGDGLRPEVRTVYIEESPFESSYWLRTSRRYFAVVDEGFAYALNLEIRQRITDPIDVMIRYENPADRGVYFRFQGLLDRGMSELQWQSSALNFELGETYEVVIEGSDRDTGELLFEHRESLLFQPTRELWLSAMSQPPPSTSDAAPRPFVISGVSLGEGFPLSPVDAAARDAERYADCWRNSDRPCASRRTDRELLDEVGLADWPFIRQLEDVARIYEHDFYNIEVTRPWDPPFVSGDRLVTYVPYFETLVERPQGRRYELMSYLIARSDDNGISWRFLKIEGRDVRLAESLDQLIPGAAERPEPAVMEEYVEEPELSRSRSLQTTGWGFIPTDDGYAYAMTWELREEFEGALSLAIHYDDPSDRSQPLSFRGSLEKGQQEIEWTSPVLTGFESGEEYEVVVEASDPASGELLFEHRQSLLFQPTRELWRATMWEPR